MVQKQWLRAAALLILMLVQSGFASLAADQKADSTASESADGNTAGVDALDSLLGIDAASPDESSSDTESSDEDGSEPASQQDASRETMASPEPSVRPRRTIEEIVVTARKREESLQDVPVVVTALSKEELERYNIGDMTKIAQMTPQLFVVKTSNGNGGTLTMRGIGSSATTSGFDQAVAINIDGIQYTRGNVLHQGYFDLGQVEVLKGPQALFFGKNSPAGVISLNTANPGDEREFLIKMGNEVDADEQFIELIASGPLTEDFGIRLAGRVGQIGSYVQNLAAPTVDLGAFDVLPPLGGIAGTEILDPLFNPNLPPGVDPTATGLDLVGGITFLTPVLAEIDEIGGESNVPAPDRDWPDENQLLGRLTMVYEPSDNFDVNVKISYADLETAGPTQGTTIYSCEGTGSAQNNPGQPCARNYRVFQNPLPKSVAQKEPLFNEEGGQLYTLYESTTIGATFNYDFGNFLLTGVSGITGYEAQYLGDFDFTGTNVVHAAESAVQDALSQEFRLLSDFDFPLNFMVGVYYQDKDFEFRNLARLIPHPADPNTGRNVTWDRVSETEGETKSAFTQLMWEISQQWEMSLGARYTEETKDSFAVNTFVHPIFSSILRPVGDPLRDEFVDENISPEVTLTWRPVDEITVFGSYKEGFKAGGFSNSAILNANTVVSDAAFASESAEGYEAGIKSSLFDGSLQLNMAVYDYEFSDLQVNFFDSAAINFVVQNAATAITRGAEMDFRWLTPVDGLDLHGSASYNLAEYEDFLSFCYAGQSFEAGCNRDTNGNQMQNPPGERQDLSGTVRPLAPEYTAALGAFYEFPLFGNLGMSLSVDANFTDDYLLSSLGRQLYQDAYTRWDASMRIFSQTDTWEVALVGRNLTDEYVILDSTDVPLTGRNTGSSETLAVVGDQGGTFGRPREVLLQFKARF